MLVSPSQPVIALTLEAAGKPAAGTAAGKAAAAHLNNAGAASVVLAARQTRQGMVQTAAVTSAVKVAQSAAQTAARVAAVKVAAQTAAVSAQTAARVASAAASAKTAAQAATAAATAGVRAASVAAAVASARPGLHLPTAPKPSAPLASGGAVASAKSGLVLPPVPKLAAPVSVPVAGVTAVAIPVAHAPVPVAASTTVSGVVTAENPPPSAVQPASAVTAAPRVAPVVSKAAASLPAGIASAGAKSGLVLPTPAIAQIPSATVPSSPSLPSLPEAVTALPSAPTVASPSSVSAPIAAEVSSSLPRVAGAKVSAPPAKTLSALSSVAPAAATPVSSLLSATPSASSLTPTTPQQQAARSETTVSAAAKSQTEAASSATGLLPDGSAVPNGVVSGGLEPEGVLLSGILSPGSLEIPASWKGVKSLYQTTTASGKTIIDIIQSPDAQFSYLNWSSFNLGAKTVLNVLQNTSLLTPVGPVASGQSTIALASVKGLFKGQGLIGGGITGGTKITKVDQTAGTITLSHPLTDPLGITSILGAILENAGTYASFNNVNGGSVSHLFGSINASGQFYLLNQSGVAFHAGSSATARGLVVSTLPINENLAGSYRYNAASGGYTATVGRGLANNPDSQFLFSALPVVGNGNLGTAAFTPDQGGVIGNVTVEKGAILQSPTDANNSGGRVALVGANVANAGSISTPYGQTILAAGLQVALTPHSSSDPSLRGFDAMIGRIADPEGIVETADPTAGSVLQDGFVSIPAGSIALAGGSITTGEGSVIDALTTTALNGRIDITATYNAVANANYPASGRALAYQNEQESGQPNSGPVTIGRGSVLRILPDWADRETKVVGESLALNSIMTVTGSSVEIGEQALLLAPGAIATAGALSMNGESLGQGVLVRAGSFFDSGGGNSKFIADRGTVSLGAGAGILLSGSSEVAAPSSDYMLSLQLRGSELADSPLLKLNKQIRAKDLVVDARYTGVLDGRRWVGTPLGDVSGYLGLVTRTAGQLTTAGGSLAILSGESVSLAPGSLLDVSGGSVRYSGGTFAPSQLIASDDRIVPVHFARPDDTYTGLVKNPPKVTEAPYSEGKSGGSILISAPDLAIDGALRGVTTTGPRQVRSLTAVAFGGVTGRLPALSEASSLPDPSSLSLALSGERVVDSIVYRVSAPEPRDVRFGNRTAAGGRELVLDPGLISRDGFRRFSLENHDGAVTLPTGVSLNAGPKGSISLEAAKLVLNGAITAPSGTISAAAQAVPRSLLNTIFLFIPDASFLGVVISRADGQPYYQYGPVHEDGSVDAVGTDGATVVTFGPEEYDVSDAGSVLVGPAARLTTAGTLVNGSASGGAAPSFVEGGTISLSGLNVSLSRGAVVDVSAGGFLGLSGRWSYGNAGSLSVLAGREGMIHNGLLGLGASLRGYATPGRKGGALSLASQAFQIGSILSTASLTEGDDVIPVASPRLFSVGQTVTGPGLEAGTLVTEIDAEGGTITLSKAPLRTTKTQLSGTYGERSLLINPQDFYGSGFSSLSLAGMGLETSYGAGLADGPSLPGIVVAPGTVIAPKVASRIPSLLPSGGVTLADPGDTPIGYAPSLSLSASGLSDGSLAAPLQIIGLVEIGRGSQIRLNPELTSLPQLSAQSWAPAGYSVGSLSLNAPTLAVAGSLSVPGGSIRISGADAFPSDQPLFSPLVTASLAPSARIDASGIALTVKDSTGVYGSVGTVLPGGSVTLSGAFFAEPGSVIDVSGASALLGMPGILAGSRSPVASVRVDSAGGSISLTGSDMFVMSSVLRGHSGGVTAPGASLEFGITLPPSPVDPALFVSQSAPDLDALWLSGDGEGPLGTHLGAEGPFGGQIGVETFQKGGFSSVRFLGSTAFTGEISMKIRGSVAIGASAPITRDPITGYVNRPRQGGVISADAPVSIEADQVSLGMAFAGPLVPGDTFAQGVFDQNFYLPPTPGDGSLDIAARQVDIGNLSLQSISSTSITARSGGIIRGDGNLVASGGITLTAGAIAPATGTLFSLTAFPLDDSGAFESLGSITTARSGPSSLPWSAGGTLSLQASVMTLGGFLSVPHGSVIIGRPADAAAAVHPVAGPDAVLPVTQSVVLAQGGGISVSGLDPLTGRPVTLPYGTSADGTSWTDPSGTDITGSGIPSKSVLIDAEEVVTEKGSVVDLRGGGELVASQWVSGLGGSVHLSDVESGNFAVLPGYSGFVAPTGYNEGGLKVGSRIRLTGGGGLPAGDYTLLPASYADLPGAFLLSPSGLQGQLPSGGFKIPDGSALVSGTRFNAFSSAPSPLLETFTVYSPAALRDFQEVRLLNATRFFSKVKGAPKTAEGARLRMSGGRSMDLKGGVRGSGFGGGTGAFVDLASTAPFVITSPAGSSSELPDGAIVLDASVLSGFDSSSLLIGGTRLVGASSTRILPVASAVTLDEGAELSGQQEFLFAAAPTKYMVSEEEWGVTPETFSSQFAFSPEDLIAANIPAFAAAFGVTEGELQADPLAFADTEIPSGTRFQAPGSSLRFSEGSSVSVSGRMSGTVYEISGDGVLGVVSSSPSVSLRRSGFTVSLSSLGADVPVASLGVDGSASFQGGSVILDSTGKASVGEGASIVASSASLAAGAVTVGGEREGSLSLSPSLLETLNRSDRLSVTGYSTITLLGGASIGSDRLTSLALHAAAIVGEGGGASLTASPLGSILLDNDSSLLPSGYRPASPSGRLDLSSGLLTLGKGSLRIDGFSAVDAALSRGLNFSSAGSLAVGGDSGESSLSIAAPGLTADGGSRHTLSATGDLSLGSGGSGSSSGGTGLGSVLKLSGKNVTIGMPVALPSGSLAVESSGNLVISSTLDLSGRSVLLSGRKTVTGAGALSLMASGDLTLAPSALLDLSAPAEGGDAGSFSLGVPNGKANLGGRISDTAPSGLRGSFSADLRTVSLSGLESYLGNASGGFSRSQSLRARSGNVDVGDVKASSFDLSADSGSITVRGKIDASGATGGKIAITSAGDLVLENGSLLDASGSRVDASGKGGLVALETTGGVVDLKSGSRIDLSLDTAPISWLGQSSGSLRITAPQVAGTGVAVNPIAAEMSGKPSLTVVASLVLDARSADPASLDAIPFWGTVGDASYMAGLSYSPGESLIGSDGNLYRLTSDKDAYREYVANEVAGGMDTDPAYSAGYWTMTAMAWANLTEPVPVGTKVLDQPGRASDGSPTGPFYLYTAKGDVDPSVQTQAPSEDPAGWELLPESGNLSYLAEKYVASPLFNDMVGIRGAAVSSFAGSLGDSVPSVSFQPGIALVNSLGGLALNSTWDLSTVRSGAVLPVAGGSGSVATEPGFLTLRASGDIVFRGSLSDGFGDGLSGSTAVGGLSSKSLLPLLDDNGTPVAQRSWSYRITSGADFAAADSSARLPASSSGITIGLPGRPESGTLSGPNASTSMAVRQLYNQYQVIRTGTGDITLSSGGDILLLSPFSSVYTAGARIADSLVIRDDSGNIAGRFDLPRPNLEGQDVVGLAVNQQPEGAYEAQFASGGGNVTLDAAANITRRNAVLNEEGYYTFTSDGDLITTSDSSLQMPSNWLYRRGAVDAKTGKFLKMTYDTGGGGDVASTAWWTDHSNFFDDIGALGGGNVSLRASGNVANVNASIPTNFRMAGYDANGNPVLAASAVSVELGGGNLSVRAGGDIDGGVYYVERGEGEIVAGGSILTNPTRDPAHPGLYKEAFGTTDPEGWLPTTLYLGKGKIQVSAGGDLRLGPVANVFLTPPGLNNSYYYKTYFSTYSPSSSVSASSLSGSVVLATQGTAGTPLNPGLYAEPLLQLWFQQNLPGVSENSPSASYFMPWLATSELNDLPTLGAMGAIMPPTLSATAFGGDISLQGNITLAPSASGNLALSASGSISGLSKTGSLETGDAENPVIYPVWVSSVVNVSDASPALVPAYSSPLSFRSSLPEEDQPRAFANGFAVGSTYISDAVAALFAETGSFAGANSLLARKLTLHEPTLLHKEDRTPVLLHAGGDLSGLTLFSPKITEVRSGGDISDVGFYLQNLSALDITTVTASGSIRLYDPASQLRVNALTYNAIGNADLVQSGFPSGDVQIAGPGTLQLLAGGNVDLGNAPSLVGDSTVWNGITSIGNSRNPGLPFSGADLVVSAGIRLPGGLDGGGLDTTAILGVLSGIPESTKLFSQLVKATEAAGQMESAARLLNLGSLQALRDADDRSLDPDEKSLLALRLFYLAIRDSGRDRNNPDARDKGYGVARSAIAAFFRNDSLAPAGITAWQRSIATANGGDISILAPSGGITLSEISTGNAGTPPGIITKHGGTISTYTSGDVSLGIGRIFTLRGGNIMMWSDRGSIAAGNSAKTVASAPPASILIDPASGDVQNDLAGLSTGGGIGVLATLAGVEPGDVDLYAPSGIIDAGDAGIRATGNFFAGATKFLNADNLQISGRSVGAPAPPTSRAAAAPASAPAAPASAPAAAPANASAAANRSSADTASKTAAQKPAEDDTPSIYAIDVLGYGGSDKEDEDENAKKSASL